MFFFLPKYRGICYTFKRGEDKYWSNYMIAIEGVIVTDKIRENNDTLIYRGYEEENKQAVVIKTSRNKLNLEHEHELLLLLNAEGSVKLRLFEERDNEAILVMEDGGVSLDNLFLYM